MKTFFSKILLLIFGFSPFLIATNVLAYYNYIPMESIPGFGKPNNFSDYVMAVYKFGLWGIGIAALFMLMFGGYTYLTSAGNTSRTGKAKEIITDALIGVFMALVSWLLLYTINPDLVKIPASITSSNNSPATVSFQNPQPSKGVIGKPFLTHINITGKGSYSLESLTLSKDNKDVTSDSTSGLNNNVIFVNIPQPKLGKYTLNITVRDQNNQTFTSKKNSLSFEIINVPPLTLETTSLKEGVSGEKYSETLTVAGGTKKYTLTANTLPSGLKLDGLTLSGTPTLKGTYPIKFTLQDGTNIIVKKELSLIIKKGSSLVPTPGEDECQNISDTRCKGNQIQYCREQGNRLVWKTQDCPNGESCSEGECGGGHNIVNDQGYKSLYNYGQDISYCSTAKCNGATNCEEDAYPCKLRNDNYQYKYTTHSTGWKDIYNLNDPRILCGADYDDPVSCNSTEATLTLFLRSLIWPDGTLPDIDSFPEEFRVFIPPGTVYAGMTIFMPINGKEGVVVRYKKSPDCSYCQHEGHPDEYYKVPWENDALNTLSDLTERDAYLPNGGGHAFVLPAFSRTTPMSPEESGWLYIKKLPFGSSRIHGVQMTIRVNVSAYLDWYNNVGQPGSEYVWDANGNPQ